LRGQDDRQERCDGEVSAEKMLQGRLQQLQYYPHCRWRHRISCFYERSFKKKHVKIMTQEYMAAKGKNEKCIQTEDEVNGWVQTMSEAAMMTPSAGNQQPWHFIIISNR
jgi:hypothetical protein